MIPTPEIALDWIEGLLPFYHLDQRGKVRHDHLYNGSIYLSLIEVLTGVSFSRSVSNNFDDNWVLVRAYLDVAEILFVDEQKLRQRDLVEHMVLLYHIYINHLKSGRGERGKEDAANSSWFEELQDTRKERDFYYAKLLEIERVTGDDQIKTILYRENDEFKSFN